MQRRGGFSLGESLAVTTGHDAAVNERVAAWLREELRRLRELEKQNASPVRRGQALSSLVIGDLAMTMVEAASFKPGKNLICLLQELLEVDRYRTANAKKRSPELEKALVLEAHMSLEGKIIGVRELAKLVGVNPSTVTIWRKSAEYKALIREAKSRLRLIRNYET